ncbi:MAG: M56 family metallopeptidase [Xanthomonadales bacterium]|nr:M56 family metallopeptidase [Xanthomonadales bacterium]
MPLTDAVIAFAHTLAWTLLHFVWQGLLIGAGWLLLRRLSPSHRWRHACALVALVACLALPIVTFVTLSAPEAGQAGTVPAVAAHASALSAADARAVMEASEPGRSPWAIPLVSLWFLGALLASLRLLADWRLLRRALREGREPPPALLALMHQQMQLLGITRKVRLRLTARISAPGVYGLLRPVILLPTALALGLPRDQVETLILHELAHIRRADLVSNVLILVARTLLYFHPVVHLVCRELERTRETLCDDLVVGLKVDRLKYARALSMAEQFRQAVPLPLLTATGGELTDRVHRILHIDDGKRQRRDRAPLVITLAFAATALAGVNLLGTDPARDLARPDFVALYRVLAPAEAPAPLTIMPGALPRPQPLAPSLAALPPAGTSIQAVQATTGTRPESPPAAAIEAPPAALAVPAPPEAMALSRPDPEPLAAAPAILAAAPTAPARAEPATAAPLPRVLRRVQPTYPRAARLQGLEGSVELAYSIDDRGQPVSVRVIGGAQASAAFEQAALEAFQRWRFEVPDGAASGARHRQIFDFNLGPDGRRCVTPIGTRICQ